MLEKVGGQVDDVYVPRLTSDDNFGVPEDPKTFKLTGSYVSHACGYMNDPQLAARNLAEASSTFSTSKHPAEFSFGKKVVKVELENGRIEGLRLDDGSKISAKAVVNAAGPWSNLVNRLAFDANGVENDSTIRNRVLRQEVVTVPAQKSVNLKEDPFWLADFDNGVYMRPEVSTNKWLIGSMEPECQGCCVFF